MQVLERILEELDRLEEPYFVGYIDKYKVKEIIINHLNDIPNTIDEQPTIYTNADGDWIPCNKRLPEEPPEEVDDEDNLEEYIVMIEGAERPTTLRYAGDGTWWEEGTYYKVIAWQPLPALYKGEEAAG